MIGPFVVDDSVIKELMVVATTANVEYHEIVMVMFLEVFNHVFNRVSVCFFEDVGGWEGHGDDSFSDVREIEFLPLISGGPLGSSDHLAYQVKH